MTSANRVTNGTGSPAGIAIILAAAITIRALTTFRPMFASFALVIGAWAVIYGWWLLRNVPA